MNRTINFQTSDRDEKGIAFGVKHPDVEGQTEDDVIVAAMRRGLDDLSDQAEAEIRSNRRHAIESLSDADQDLLTKIVLKLPQANESQKPQADVHLAALAESLGVDR